MYNIYIRHIVAAILSLSLYIYMYDLYKFDSHIQYVDTKRSVFNKNIKTNVLDTSIFLYRTKVSITVKDKDIR